MMNKDTIFNDGMMADAKMLNVKSIRKISVTCQ